jgi:hypothetical protein
MRGQTLHGEDAMKTILSALLFAAATASGDHDGPAARAELLDGLGAHRHPVSTQVAEAQKFFDQGLALLYAFNHDEAALSFARAAELDPQLAMAYWGVALARGPNYNLDADAEQWLEAYAASKKALELATAASPPEQDYIRALALRYGPDAKADRKPLAEAYRKAMGEVARKYPDDFDAAVLYAESAMNLRPWKLWSPQGQPAEGTEEIVAVLESVLRRAPEQIGANHYYIHAVEASPLPERALASANRLGAVAPAAGHLVHMPSHIYSRVGDYAASAEANERAIAADRKYLERRKPRGAYPMMYVPHNIHFLAVARAFEGQGGAAAAATRQLALYAEPHVKAMPMLEGFLVVPPLMQVRLGRWDDILAAPLPHAERKLTRAAWHYARARAALAKGDVAGAGAERAEFMALQKTLPEDTMVSTLNTAHAVFAIAAAELEARFALQEGKRARAVELLRQAAQLEDALHYTEPPDWIAPVRETLGAVLYLAGSHQEAEQVFRAGLARNRRSGRCLFGLRESLRAQGNDYAAAFIDVEFQTAWRRADFTPRLEDF